MFSENTVLFTLTFFVFRERCFFKKRILHTHFRVCVYVCALCTSTLLFSCCVVLLFPPKENNVVLLLLHSIQGGCFCVTQYNEKREPFFLSISGPWQYQLPWETQFWSTEKGCQTSPTTIRPSVIVSFFVPFFWKGTTCNARCRMLEIANILCSYLQIKGGGGEGGKTLAGRP